MVQRGQVAFGAAEVAIVQSDVQRQCGACPPLEELAPQFERATLSNGLELVLARATAIPQVRFSLLLDAGYAADQFGIPGTASLTMAMLDEGTRTRSSIAISASSGTAMGARTSKRDARSKPKRG